MATKGSRRIYESSVIRWIQEHWTIFSSSVGVLAIALISYLSFTGAITISDYSGDLVCSGTPNDLCVAFITFKANTDIFVYPSSQWGLDTDKPIKNLQMYRTWGSGASIESATKGDLVGLRKIDLSKPCTGTWCGGTGTGEPTYSLAFRKGKNYTIVYTAEKQFPFETVKWGFGFNKTVASNDYVDPAWIGTGGDNVKARINIENLSHGRDQLVGQFKYSRANNFVLITEPSVSCEWRSPSSKVKYCSVTFEWEPIQKFNSSIAFPTVSIIHSNPIFQIQLILYLENMS